jgi:hypothetical protein
MAKIFLFLVSYFLLTSCVQGQNNPFYESNQTEVTAEEIDSLPIHQRLKDRALSLKVYLKKYPNYSQKTAILIDMRQHSGKKRLFVYDLDSMKILSSSLVSHGSGSETGIKDSLQFSNTPNSYMSSLGKYKIGGSYIGNFGKSYKLHGLDATNSKAYDRLVVLHRYSCVPDEEQVYEICNSLGCPMVSENYFLELDSYINASKQPMLMEIYY